MNQQRPGSAPDGTPEADLLADMGDYPELHTMLAELRDLGQGPAPEPSPELAAFFKPKVVPLRRKRRGAVIGVVVAASMSLGVGAVAANEEVRENLYAAVDTAMELVQPDELEASNQANDGGASDNALPALPPVVAMPGGADIPAGAGQRVERPGGPVKAAAKEPGNQGDKEPGTQRGKSSSAAAPAPDPAGQAAAGQGRPADGHANDANDAKAKANDKAHGKPKANKPQPQPHLPADEAVRNAVPKAAPYAGKAQQPAKRLLRRAVEGAPLVNKGQDNRAPGQAEDKGRGAAEKQSGPVEKIVEKGVDPTVERLGRTLGNVADRD